MTEQEIFDKVAIFLMNQRKKSYSDDNGCMYRNHEGLKCAVGCLIPEDYYDPSMEGMSLKNVISKVPGLLSHYSLLGNLQCAHDQASDREEDYLSSLIVNMKEVASDWNLSPAVLG